MHADPQLSLIEREIRSRVPHRLEDELARIASAAVEFVLDPVTTGRTRVSQLDNVEKTFVGLKVEHFLRDLLDAPKGVRDLELNGRDVDVKHTLGRSWCWMIPPETFRAEEPCLLVATDENTRQSWLGIIIARDAYLGSPNRDGKRRVNSAAFEHILWLVDGVQWSPDPWAGLDMARFRQLRGMKGGNNRAAAFFRENLRRPTHRTVISALLYPQVDAPKRLRENGGAKSILQAEGIALLSGLYFKDLLAQLGFVGVERDEFISIAPINEQEVEILVAAGQLPPA